MTREADMRERINTFRRAEGLRPLRMNPVLRALAEGHAGYMNHHSRYSHDGIQRRERGWDRFGEVVGMTDPPSAYRMLCWWATESPEHRRIILIPDWTVMGVGYSGDYWCVDFGQR